MSDRFPRGLSAAAMASAFGARPSTSSMPPGAAAGIARAALGLHPTVVLPPQHPLVVAQHQGSARRRGAPGLRGLLAGFAADVSRGEANIFATVPGPAVAEGVPAPGEPPPAVPSSVTTQTAVEEAAAPMPSIVTAEETAAAPPATEPTPLLPPASLPDAAAEMRFPPTAPPAELLPPAPGPFAVAAPPPGTPVAPAAAPAFRISPLAIGIAVLSLLALLAPAGAVYRSRARHAADRESYLRMIEQSLRRSDRSPPRRVIRRRRKVVRGRPRRRRRRR